MNKPFILLCVLCGLWASGMGGAQDAPPADPPATPLAAPVPTPAPAGLEPIAADAVLAQSLTLQIGDQKVLNVYNSNRVSIGSKGVVDVRVLDDDEILVTGMALGATEIVFWTDTRQRQTVSVQVVPPLNNLARDLQALLGGIHNLSITSVGGRVVLDGRLLTKEDADRIAAVAKPYGEEAILNLTVLDRGPENVLVEQFIKKMSGLDTINVQIVGGTAYLTGFVSNPAEKDQLLNLVKTQVTTVVDLLSVRELMIDMDIIFIKVTRSDGANVGINLFNGDDQGFQPQINLSGSKAKVNDVWSTMDIGVNWTLQLTPTINYILSEGDGSVLARPHIVTKSGEKGTFQSGGTLYYKIAGAMAAEMRSVDYGMILAVTPTFKNGDEILSVVSMEFSIPTQSSGSADLSVDKFSIANTVSCRLGQSIILSGFAQTLRNYLNAGTPILGDIPLIKLLFNNRSRDDSDTEVLAIITPRVLNLPAVGVDPLAGGTNMLERMDAVLQQLNNRTPANP